MRNIGEQTALHEARQLLHEIWSKFTGSEEYDLEIKAKFGRLDAVVIEMARDGVDALKFVDRLYTTKGGTVNSQHYGLIANSPDCGKMIDQVQRAIRSIGEL